MTEIKINSDGESQPAVFSTCGTGKITINSNQTVVNKPQPISTAPKDGTAIIVFYEIATVQFAHIAFYRDDSDYEHCKDPDGETLDEYVGWWAYTLHPHTQEKLDEFREPTHWIPLPD